MAVHGLLPRCYRVWSRDRSAQQILYEPGAQPKVIQEMGGWSSIDIVMNRYGHLFDTLQDDLADKQEASYRALAEGRTGT